MLLYNNRMQQSIFDAIRVIATDVREWVQARADRTDYGADSLCGWCAIASAELSKRLISAGIDCTICLSRVASRGYHCFVMIDDYVLDVTATQFREYEREPVVFLHSKEAEVNDYHIPVNEFSTAKALRVYQSKVHWPSYQICYA